jgi:hypothetical protein
MFDVSRMCVQGEAMSLQSSARWVRTIAGFASMSALTWLRVGSRTWFRTWAQLVLSCLAAPLLLQAAHAQDVSARVEWYGAYAVSESKAVDDPRSPTGRRVIATPVAPTSNTDRIPGRDGTRFGLSYVLGGSGKEVEVRRVFRFPGDGMPNASTGRKTGSYEDLQTYTVGESVLMGWSFEGAPPERILFGEWVFEVWVGNEKVVGRRFTVFRP